MKTIAVIPAYNEATVIGDVVQQVLGQVDTVIVVDDCSKDETAVVARRSGAQVLRHAVQRGAGRATATGLLAALRLGADLIVTLDADGQHLADEIQTVLAPLRVHDADLVVGCRVQDRKSMPVSRRLGNRFANFWTWALLGASVSDSQSGFRAYSRTAAQRLPLHSRGYEFCSQTLGAAVKLGLKIAEVPITVVYTEYSMAKGQSFWTAVQTLIRIAKAGFR